MDILIKDLAIPEDGAYDYHLTIRSDGKVEGWQQVGQRIVRIHSWAVEVPPHGRLVDADEAIDHWDAEMMVIDRYSMRQFLNRIPTVLEASE